MANPIQLYSTVPGQLPIIDGISDTFKIVAQGGIVTTGGPSFGTAQSFVTLTTGVLGIPTCLVWSQGLDTNTGQNAGEQCPSLILNLSTGAIAYMYEGWAENTNVTGVTRIVCQTTATNAGGGGTIGFYAFYVMQEVSF